MGLSQSEYNLPKYNYNDVMGHNNENDCWIIVDGYVYDVTLFLRKHKTGPNIILKHAGTDCSTYFKIHSSGARTILKQYLVGSIRS